jgi:VWFA-related protein
MKAFVLLALAAAVATPPTPQKTVPYLESIEVTVNNVDVIVTDRDGHRVHGLQKSDFELLENNAPQAISNFYEVRGAARAPVAAAPSDAAAPEVAPQQEPRKFVMLFDELSLHPAIAGDLERRANELVDTTLQPGDELMVLTPRSKTKIALPFTSDKRAMHKAIGGVMRDSAFHTNTALMREMMLYERDVRNAGRAQGPSAAAMYEMVVSRRVRQTLGYLQAVVTALAEVPGKKSVIFVTLSAPVEPGRDAYDLTTDTSSRPNADLDAVSTPIVAGWRTLQPMINDIARTASTNGIPIYCLQPDVALGSSIPDVVTSGGAGRGGVRILSNPQAGPSGASFAAASQGTQRTFETLSDTTGGKWWRGGSGVKPLFQQVAEDATDYYSLGYRAASEVRDKTRSIVVRVRNHHEYDVRSRHAVIRKSAPNEMRDLVIARLLDDRPIDELNVRVSAGHAKREATGSLLVPVDIKIPLSKLTFLRDGEVYRASFRVHYAAESSAFDFAPGEGREQIVEVPSAEMKDIGGKYFTYTSSLRVMPGHLKVSVGVLDPLSHLATIKTMTVEAR